jgi:hypothetical protein
MVKRTIVTAATLLAAALCCSTASAQDPVQVTYDSTERETVRPNRPMLYTGLAVIAASYIPPVVVAATSSRAGDEYLYIPLAGPWIDLGERGGCGPNPCGEEAVYKGLLIATGVAHVVGTGLILSSLFVPEERIKERTSAKPVVVPAQVGRSGAGLMVVGTF